MREEREREGERQTDRQTDRQTGVCVKEGATSKMLVVSAVARNSLTLSCVLRLALSEVVTLSPPCFTAQTRTARAPLLTARM